MAEETDQSTNSTLLGRLQQAPTRDAAAWQEFVRRYGRQVFQWCQRWGLQPADAEDVTQAVLVKMLDRMATFRYDASESFRGRLRTVTHNAWKKFIASSTPSRPATTWPPPCPTSSTASCWRRRWCGCGCASRPRWRAARAPRPPGSSA
jgi:DNA-directed RNA polymerase specialized sigma24 family protein